MKILSLSFLGWVLVLSGCASQRPAVEVSNEGTEGVVDTYATHAFFIAGSCSLQTPGGAPAVGETLLVFPGDRLLFTNTTDRKVCVCFSNSAVTGRKELVVEAHKRGAVVIPNVESNSHTKYRIVGCTDDCNCERFPIPSPMGEPTIKVGDYP